MSSLMGNDSEYLQLFKHIAGDIADTRLRVTQGANAEVVKMYWRTGREIDARAMWGSKFIDTLSHDIRMAFPGIKGFSVRNLKYMAKFARETSEELCNSCCTIPWGHFTHIMDKVEPGEKPVGVSEYRLADVLPSEEDIRHRVFGLKEVPDNE